MNRWIVVPLVLVACKAKDPNRKETTSEPVPLPEPAPAPPDEGIDVLAAARALNADPAAAPPSEFRPGHVLGKATAPSVSARKNGFVVKLPSAAPVVTPAVYDGKVIVSGGFQSREVYALDARSGAVLWSIALDDDGPSTAACAEGTCLINTESCTIYSVDAATGALNWAHWLGDPLLSSPTIADGRVFSSYPAAGSNGATHALAAFDLKTGKVIWQKWIDGDVMSAPVATGGHLYVTTFAGTVMKLDPASGAILSARKTRATSAPTVVGGHVYYTRRSDFQGSRAKESIVKQDSTLASTAWQKERKPAPYLDGQVQSLTAYAREGGEDDAANGFTEGAPQAAQADVAWSLVGQKNVSTLQAFQGSRVLSIGGRNVNTMGDEILATDPATGATLWSHHLDGDLAKSGGYLGSAPAAAGGHVIVATLSGDILRLDPADGKVVARYAADAEVRAQPVVEDGWIYVGTQDGRLVAIGTGDARLDGWPMWGGNAARSGTN